MKLKKIIQSVQCPLPDVPNQHIKNWLKEKGLHPVLLEELSLCSYSGPIRINNIYFNRFNELIDENLDEQNKKCIENGFLIIGSGLNGDPIVVSIKDEVVGFVSHDELWEEEDCSFHEMLALTELDIFDFFFQAQSDNFPVDCFECEEKGLSI